MSSAGTQPDRCFAGQGGAPENAEVNVVHISPGGMRLPDEDMAARLHPNLIRAYRETSYEVHGNPGFSLHICISSPDLHELLKSCSATTAAFITAYNPYGRVLSVSENQDRQRSLERTLLDGGFLCFQGAGKHHSNGWPAEASVLVPGISLSYAGALAHQFEQNAFVYVEAGGVPQLVCQCPIRPGSG